MRFYNIEDIDPINVIYVVGHIWVTYDPNHRNNDDIGVGTIINCGDRFYEVEYDAMHEDGYIAICTLFYPDLFPLNFVKSLVDGDVYEKYFEWIKTNK